MFFSMQCTRSLFLVYQKKRTHLSEIEPLFTNPLASDMTDRSLIAKQDADHHPPLVEAPVSAVILYYPPNYMHILDREMYMRESLPCHLRMQMDAFWRKSFPNAMEQERAYIRFITKKCTLAQICTLTLHYYSHIFAMMQRAKMLRDGYRKRIPYGTCNNGAANHNESTDNGVPFATKQCNLTCRPSNASFSLSSPYHHHPRVSLSNDDLSNNDDIHGTSETTSSETIKNQGRPCGSSSPTLQQHLSNVSSPSLLPSKL